MIPDSKTPALSAEALMQKATIQAHAPKVISLCVAEDVAAEEAAGKTSSASRVVAGILWAHYAPRIAEIQRRANKRRAA